MKNIVKLFFIFSIFISLTACGGTNLVDDFFASQSNGSGAIDVMALQHLRDGSAGEITPEGTKVFTNDLGYEIELTHASLHFHRLSLFSDGDDPECIGGNDQDILIHHTLDLLGEDLLTHHLATAVIPTAFFCEFEVQLGHNVAQTLKFHEDGDGEGDPDQESEAFHLMGHWSKDGDSGDFELMGMEETVISHVFKAKENDEIIEHPLHFHEGETVVEVLIGTKYDLIFDGVDFMSQSVDEQIDTIYENLQTAVHQHVGDHHGSAGSTDDGGHTH